MRERPIIINADMVRAVLDGRKTQTRRIIAPSIRTADVQFELHQQADGSWTPLHTFNEGTFDKTGSERPIKCPFGAVGDHLWVRETFATLEPGSYEPVTPHDGYAQIVRYAASDRLANSDRDVRGFNWRPSIHMPRWASRITLEITGVRVERLQDISEQDALAEGVRRRESTPVTDPAYCNYLAANLNDASEWFDLPSDSFISLWQSIYGAESWQANPWVWVIEFKRVGDES